MINYFRARFARCAARTRRKRIDAMMQMKRIDIAVLERAAGGFAKSA